MSLSRRIQLFVSFLTMLVFISACSNPSINKLKKNTPISKVDSVVSVKWLSEHLNDPDLVILDTTVIVNIDDSGAFSNVSGQDDYNAGHIPTAGFADLKGNLSATGNVLDFVMPTPQNFQAAMQELGVGNDSRVVLYSAKNQVWAARLWWMLRWAGFDQVAVLDGGLNAWKAEGLPLSTKASKHSKKIFTLALRPEVIADQKEVFAATKNSYVDIVDALPEAHFMGQFSLYSRPGHIPGATNIPSSILIDESGLFQPLDELDMLIEGNHNNRVITYCGGGVAASSVAFAMYRLGYTDVAVYMGSLQEWVTSPQNPMIVDAP